MKLRNIFAAATFAATAFATATPALAYNYNTSMSAWDTSFGVPFANEANTDANHLGVNKGTFSDVFEFSLAELAVLLNVSVTDSWNINTKNISAMNVSLFQVVGLVDPLNAQADDINLGSFVVADTNAAADSANKDYFNVAAGNYYVAVTGDASGKNGGSYIVQGNYTPEDGGSNVPEAETYAMLLGGLGLIGFVARRRRMA